MAKLPPCRRSLEQHIRRVNYQMGIWKRAHLVNTDIPVPIDGHGWTLVNGKLEPLWYEGHVLPQQLADIAEKSVYVDDDSDSDEENTSDVDYINELCSESNED